MWRGSEKQDTRNTKTGEKQTFNELLQMSKNTGREQTEIQLWTQGAKGMNQQKTPGRLDQQQCQNRDPKTSKNIKCYKKQEERTQSIIIISQSF